MRLISLSAPLLIQLTGLQALGRGAGGHCSTHIITEDILRTRAQLQNILGGGKGLSSENFVCDLFCSKNSWSNVPGTSKLPCRTTLYCRFCPAKWHIFEVGGGGDSPQYSPVHKLLGNFSATFSLLSDFQCIGQLLSFCVSLVTVMLLLRVKQLKSAEYQNIACVENIFVQSFSFTIR